MRMRIIDNTSGGYRYFEAMFRLDFDDDFRFRCWKTHPGEVVLTLSIPITFMHGIYLPTFTIKNQPNVGQYTIGESYGRVPKQDFPQTFPIFSSVLKRVT